MQLNGLPNNVNTQKLDWALAPIARKESTDPAAVTDGLALGERTSAEPKFLNAFYDSKTGTVNYPAPAPGAGLPFDLQTLEEAPVLELDPNFVPPAATPGQPAGHTYVAGLSLRSSASLEDSDVAKVSGTPHEDYLFAGSSFADQAGSMLSMFAKDLETTTSTLYTQMQADADKARMQRHQQMTELEWLVSDAKKHAAGKKEQMREVLDGYIRP